MKNGVVLALAVLATTERSTCLGHVNDHQNQQQPQQNQKQSPKVAGDIEKLPLFVTFDSGIPVDSINSSVTPFIDQERFVWGVGNDATRIAAYRKANPNIRLSYYMPYSRAPAASLGFDLAFWQATHPDWILYQCDRKTVSS